MSDMDYRSPESVPLLTDAAGGQQQRQKAEIKRSKLLTVCPFILGNEFCERLAYYGLATNLVTYLTHIMGVDAAAAAIQVMVFEGTCYITPLLGAYLADSHWGRYKTILVFSTIYLCGCVLLTATSGLPGLTPGPYDDATWVQQAALFGALGVIALGTGGIKPNVSAFGADQFDEKDPQDKREKESFFNWFYLAINIGSLIACTVIVYVQDQVSWTVGFALPASAMASAVLLFLAGSKHYRHVAPTESPMARVVKVVSAALHNRWYNRSNKPAALTDSSSTVQQPPQQQQQQQQQQGKAWGSSSGPSQPLLIGPPAPRPLPPGSSGSSISNSLLASSPGRFMSSSPQRSLAFYQQQQQQQHKVVYGFSPEPSPHQLQAEASGSSGGSMTRPPRPLGSTSPQPLPYQQQQQQQWVGGPGMRGPSGGVGQRTGSFSWLESAIVEWQTAQGQLQGSRLQQQQQQQQQQQGGLSSGLRQQQQQQQGDAGGYSPQQVEEVKMVLRLLPVFATTVIYWTIYSMMGTFFIQQGSLMDNSIPLPAWLGGRGSRGSCGSSGSSSDAVCLHIPAATMALFNTGAIILLVPLYDAFLEPAIKAAGVRWTLLRRIGWGMVIAVLAMFYAACVERWRLDIYESMEAGGDSSSSSAGGGGSGGYGPSVVPLSIMWQAPAYMLIGGSEVLASIAQLEFFYDQAPDVMRSCSMALQLLSTAVGSYLGGGLVAGVAAATSAAGAPWLPKDLNTGHLDLFLWLCGGLMAANTLLFVLVANGYEYKAVEHVVWVQVPDEEEGAEGTEGDGRLPPRAPSPAAPARRAGAAIAINASAARRSQYHYAAREEGEEEGQLYSRSLAFVPPSPALPAPFR